jgi:hypothetical protein
MLDPDAAEDQWTSLDESMRIVANPHPHLASSPPVLSHRDRTNADRNDSGRWLLSLYRLRRAISYQPRAVSYQLSRLQKVL